MQIQVIAPGCTGLLEGTGYRHRQTFEGTLEDALRVVGELHRHGLDVMLAQPRTPLLAPHDAVRICVVPEPENDPRDSPIAHWLRDV
jgi:hypothetical protein